MQENERLYELWMNGPDPDDYLLYGEKWPDLLLR